MNKYPMPTQDPKIRNQNFNEVALGYDLETAQLEAKRCLQCRHQPCVSGCPVNIDIPRFIKHIVQGDVNQAYETILEDNLFPAICGRVCPQETQCEAKCVRAIKGESVAIGRLERFVADHTTITLHSTIISNHIPVAIVGSGPSGLTCASELRKMGYDVTLFEALHAPGGVLTYGIPEFRLPKHIVQSEIHQLTSMGVRIICNAVIGKTMTIDQLFEAGYEAIYIASGAGLPKFMGIPGENYNGVFSANEFLTRINLMKSYKKSSDTPLYPVENVCVVGGGNVAMDAARSAKRMGATNVYIIYRRSEKEMPARLEEIEHAKEEGIIFRLLTNPIEVIGDNQFKVTKLRCIEMELGEPDASNRRTPVPKPDSTFDIVADNVIMALGNYPNPLLIRATKGLTADRWGCLQVDETQQTSLSGVFAGGDAVTGAATVILAMEAGKKAATSMHQYILKKHSE